MASQNPDPAEEAWKVWAGKPPNREYHYWQDRHMGFIAGYRAALASREEEIAKLLGTFRKLAFSYPPSDAFGELP